MATTAQEIFDSTMGLMDEVNESNGSTDNADTQEYKNRTLFILNILRGELYPYSDTFENSLPGKRPIVSAITTFDEPIGLDDYICQSVMPYGLAAHLLLDENPTSAAFFNERYEELKANLARGLTVQSEDIEDVYSGWKGDPLGYGWFSRW